ncbi:glycogen debranching N-terminal domain-containing protein [Arthrobacter crystallopoietes]|uniref:Glycogen debranching enzyme (Alpha-1,6-glucosidase) n=1 Tax=Crystallibacter crystallopoietes TaxID=37928 RepID=A0A1H0Z965_9MICC|nr:glycogen debranching N-terminal domain-containing protein [Arthrobacter crystallopoietes]AUI52095.1 amylo-alpha-1,6-glucosidase [Arthrobacter crystallopoietes]SDQ23975.1 Glycogen debranching enzyme (alpha-1,6-glucosidase) [Arthrobacter crystallopoietes]
MTGWSEENTAGSAGEGAVTLLQGTSFCISFANGDMNPERPHGFFYRDTRFISDWSLSVNGRPVEPLEAILYDPYRAVFIGRAERTDGLADSNLLVERRRSLNHGVHEDVTVSNHSREPAACQVQLTVGADFADLFEVKAGLKEVAHAQPAERHTDNLIIESEGLPITARIVVAAEGAEIAGNRISYSVVIPPQQKWTGSFTALPDLDRSRSLDDLNPRVQVHSTLPEERLMEWRRNVPLARMDNKDFEKVLEQSQADLGSLRIFDPDHPGRVVVAAGSPWFMALFGRDSLLTSFMTLPLDPSLALGTLQTLAERQGTEVDPRSEEQPGKILHEVRFGASAGQLLGGDNAYYGSVDATPLFVTLAGELTRWGFWPEVAGSLLPAVDKALDWITQYGDIDGDGFVEYARATDKGLLNQGWKDSWDGVNFADGRLASPPIALCEVQGYVYAAYISRALMAQSAGDNRLAAHWGSRAADLKRAFNEQYWLEDRGYFAIALDHDKRPVDSCASNMGHCLWSGIVDNDKAPLVAQRLMSPEMFCGWGVRTLASDMGAYNPASYHNGSVWPHDNALIAGGLMRYGFIDEAKRIVLALFNAATQFGGRLPELFCGLDRESYPVPVPYPTSCSPQAWAAAAPVHLMRMLLRFDPCMTHNGLWLAPQIPAELGALRVTNLPLAGARISVTVADGQTQVDGIPESIELHRKPRKPLADLLDVYASNTGN